MLQIGVRNTCELNVRRVEGGALDAAAVSGARVALPSSRAPCCAPRLQPLAPQLNPVPHYASNRPLLPHNHCHDTVNKQENVCWSSLLDQSSLHPSQQVGRQLLRNFKREWNVPKDWHCLHDPYMLKSYKSAGMGWDWMDGPLNDSLLISDNMLMDLSNPCWDVAAFLCIHGNCCICFFVCCQSSITCSELYWWCCCGLERPLWLLWLWAQWKYESELPPVWQNLKSWQKQKKCPKEPFKSS